MAVAYEKKKHTYEDYCGLPDEPRVELIDGEFLVSPAPRTKHQWISSRIQLKLTIWIDEKKLGKVFPAPTDVVFSENDVVQPDIIFISNDRKQIITELNIQGAPDLVIEILSPGHEERDTILKKSCYEKFGVKEYWIADPALETITVFVLENSAFALKQTYGKEDSLESTLLPGFRLTLTDVFSVDF